MSKPKLHRFEYLRHQDGLFTVGLIGPRQGDLWLQMSEPDMARLVDEYHSIYGAAPEVDRPAASAVMHLRQAAELGTPVILNAARHVSLTIHEATTWGRHVLNEIRAQQEG